MPKEATKDSTSSQPLSMEEWFRTATQDERDAMTALQLEYRFLGDNLSSMWWLHLQGLEFKHHAPTYELPKSAPPSCREKRYSGTEIYEHLDKFAIPLPASPFQTFAIEPIQDAGNDWWRQVRDELLYRKFHKEIEGFEHASPEKKVKDTKGINKQNDSQIMSLGKRKVSATSSDNAVELYLRKGKKGKKSSRNGVASSTESKNMGETVVFPTIQEYAEDVIHSFDSSQVEQREQELATLFEKWKFQAIMNHSLLFYGIGSKRNLLNRLATELEDEGNLMVVDGFDKDVTIEDILDLMMEKWLGEKIQDKYMHSVDGDLDHPLTSRFGLHCHTQRGDNALVQKSIFIAATLARFASSTKRPFHLILHNIDGVGLRNPTAQEALAALVNHSGTSRGLNAFRLITSIDHINSPALLWDSLTRARFNWAWTKADTYRPYVEELLRGASVDETVSIATSTRHRTSNSAPEHKSIFTVLSSLAPRVTEALQQLASLQVAKVAQGEMWVGYKALLRQCMHSCVVSTDNALRNFLKELSDHGIVEQSSSVDTSALSFRIPHGVATLRQILDYDRKL